MDLFETLRHVPSVKKVSNLPQLYNPFFYKKMTFLFFLCPALTAKGIRVNRSGTGVMGKYAPKDKLSSSTIERLMLVKQFHSEISRYDMKYNLVAVYATADALIVYSPPAGPPPIPELPFTAIANHHAVYDRLDLWNEYYRSEPWSDIPQRFVDEGKKRLQSLLPDNCPQHLQDDFVKRILAGFALDGQIIKSGYFGNLPILLGVESPEVAVLQNATLPREERIPVVQLA